MSVNSRILVLVSTVMLSAPSIRASDFEQVSTGPTVSFARDVQPIFDNRCVNCHGPPTVRGGLDLTAKHSYANLVGVPTTTACQMEVPDSVRVLPSCAQGSMLWLKSRPDDARCRGIMPLMTEGLGVIAPDEFAIIEQWILEGAPNN